MRVCYCQMDDDDSNSDYSLEEGIDWNEEEERARWAEYEFQWAEYQREQYEMYKIIEAEEMELQQKAQQALDNEEYEQFLRDEEIANSLD